MSDRVKTEISPMSQKNTVPITRDLKWWAKFEWSKTWRNYWNGMPNRVWGKGNVRYTVASRGASGPFNPSTSEYNKSTQMWRDCQRSKWRNRLLNGVRWTGSFPWRIPKCWLLNEASFAYLTDVFVFSCRVSRVKIVEEISSACI